jgi:outer membrane protein assembly factor BamB
MGVRILVTASLLTSLGSPLFADWPQWRGPNRDGVASAFTPPSVWPAQLNKKWEAPVGLGHASPVVAGGKLIVHARQGEQEVVTAFDLASGKQLWREGIAVPYTMNPAALAHGPGPKATPAVAGGRVFTFGISGILSAHDLDTGRLLWRKDAPTAPPEFGTASSPIVDGSKVIAFLGGANGGALTAMDAATGKEVWRWSGDSPAYASPVMMTVAGVRQVVTQSKTKVIGLNAADGKLLWEVPLKTPYDQNSVTPLVVNDVVISAGLDNPTHALWVRAAPGNAWQATPRWSSARVSMYMSSPTVSGTTIYGLSHRNRGQFFAIDAATGNTLWLGKGREGDNASVVSAGDFLLLSTTDSELIVARANAKVFEEVKRYTIANSATWAHPAYAGRAIVVKDVDKVIVWGF